MDEQIPVSPSIQSLGGQARAQKLTPEQRREIASKAARAKWKTVEGADAVSRVAIAEGELKLGEAILQCAVLDDGTRVVSERALGRAFGRKRGGRDWSNRATSEHGGELPFFLATQKLKPFVENDLGLAGYSRIPYRTGGRLAYGTKAELIPNICDVWLKARDILPLNKWQKEIAHRADVLMRGLAQVGITALVDEATGYQEVRDRSELQQILKAYISPTLLPWTEKFPQEFFQEMFRVYGWPWPPAPGTYKGPQGPRYAGKLIRKIIYENLPPGVLDELDKSNPPDEKWQRRSRMPQLLSESFGHPHVEKLVAVITALFRISEDRYVFWKAYRKAFPKAGDQTEMDLDEQ